MSSSRRPTKAAFHAAARECGFALSGVAKAEPLDEYSVYNQWVADGMAGRMGYLAGPRGALRTDPRLLLPSARSVLCVGKLYNTVRLDERISRYAQGDDYHDVLRADLERLVAGLKTEWGDFEARICVDTAPLLERALARKAGLGWIGRNTCLIHEATGSWYFLGEVLVSVELDSDAPPPDRCGTCMRCVEACPTQALVPGGPDHVLDSRRCISYFTIELKDVAPKEMRPGIGEHLFGCDICQEVCPWNSGAPLTAENSFHPRGPAAGLEELAELSEDGFRERYRTSPVWRTRHRGMLRNVSIAMGNSGLGKFRPALERLAAHEDKSLGEAAAWALGRLSGR